ncbi:MAG TPA: methyltransferase domain-containing protein [Thermomicrobiales bacterium]
MTEGTSATSPVVDQQRTLHTASGDFPLQEYNLREGGRSWAILHTGAILSRADESHFLGELTDRLPYGVALWPAAIALAHEMVARADVITGKRILELGAGTGLAGIVAASLGGRVVQTDRNELTLSVCRRNGERNDTRSIEYRLADWTAWDDTGHYDWIIGSDILYGEVMHPALRQIFAANLAPGGQIVIADPFRAVSFKLLEELEAEGWSVVVSTWQIGEVSASRPIGLFELAPPR